MIIFAFTSQRLLITIFIDSEQNRPGTSNLQSAPIDSSQIKNIPAIKSKKKASQYCEFTAKGSFSRELLILSYLQPRCTIEHLQ